MTRDQARRDYGHDDRSRGEEAVNNSGSLLDGSLGSLLERLDRRLGALYGDKYRGLILYGSHARQEADAGSDVDLLLILDGEVDPVVELRRVHPVKWPLALEAGYTVAIVPVGFGEYLRADRSPLRNARRESLRVP